MLRSIAVLSALVGAAAFSVAPTGTRRMVRRANWIKDAFNSPEQAAEISADRETPFDRWMGISVKSASDEAAASADAKQGVSADAFIDSMDEASYIVAKLKKPMGIVFEENEPQIGGVFISSVEAGGNAAESGALQPGDQLVSVGATSVRGMDFDAALDAVRNFKADTVPLLVFRGESQYLYGRLGPSEEWLGPFLAKTAFDE